MEVEDFFSKVGEIMAIAKPSDWYKVKRKDVVKYGGQSILNQCQNSLYKVFFEYCTVTYMQGSNSLESVPRCTSLAV